MLLAQDETEVQLFPPLRAHWSLRGVQVRVVLCGRNAKRVIFGALNLLTGERVLLLRYQQQAKDFCSYLRHVRSRYPGRSIAMLLDEHPAHTAQASRRLAKELGILLLWLPKRCPELNPMDHLWRAPKQEVCANRQDPEIELSVRRFLRYLRRLTPREALCKAGVLSEGFWLRFTLSKFLRRPT